MKEAGHKLLKNAEIIMNDRHIIDGILYRKAVPEVDDPKIISLYNDTFNRVLSTEWFRWFNYSCPFGANRLYVAEDQATSHIISAYGLLPYKVKFNDEVIDASICTNVVTHPDYQGRDIFVNLGKFALAREHSYRGKIYLGVPNKNALRGHLKVGWEVLCDLDFIVSYVNKPEEFQAAKIDRFGENLDILLSTLVNKMNFAIIKDHHFLNWRYFNRPDKEYHVYVRQNENIASGLIVLKYFEEYGYKKAHILDIYAVSENVFNDLLNAAKSFAAQRDCQQLNCWQIKNSPYAPWFHKRGFKLSTEKNTLIVRNDFKIKSALINRYWWFMLGDNDVY